MGVPNSRFGPTPIRSGQVTAIAPLSHRRDSYPIYSPVKRSDEARGLARGALRVALVVAATIATSDISGGTSAVARDGPVRQIAVQPPSTVSTAPVTNELASLARKSSAPSSSWASPPRPIGVRARI